MLTNRTELPSVPFEATSNRPHFHKPCYNSSRLVRARLRPAEGMRSTMEDDFELQWSELADTLGQTGLDILASLVPGACAATLAHSSMRWTIGCAT